MSKSQFSVEFILLFTLVMFIFLLLLVAAEMYMESSSDTDEKNKLDSVGELIKKEIILAKTSPSEFKSDITLPPRIDGSDYSIVFDDEETFTIKHGSLNVSTTQKIPKLMAIPTLLPGNCYTIKKISSGELRIDPC